MATNSNWKLDSCDLYEFEDVSDMHYTITFCRKRVMEHRVFAGCIDTFTQWGKTQFPVKKFNFDKYLKEFVFILGAKIQTYILVNIKFLDENYNLPLCGLGRCLSRRETITLVFKA